MCNATVNRFGLGLGSDRREWCCRCRREWFGAIANGSHRRDWVWVQIVVNGSESSRMVQIVANGLDCRREWFGAIANGSHRRDWVWVQIVANGSKPSQMVQTVAKSYQRRFRSYWRR